MGWVLIFSIILVAVAGAGMAVGIIVKGKFPDTHVGQNAEMRKMGITCVKNDSDFCKGRPDTDACTGCRMLHHAEKENLPNNDEGK